MSLTTWKAEFYPVDAEDATSTPLEAARHSLRKWEGLREGNLNQHDLHVTLWGDLEEDPERDNCPAEFEVDGFSCALCRRTPLSCNTCPIMIKAGSDCIVQFDTWGDDEDPEPMIELLKSTVKALEEDTDS